MLRFACIGLLIAAVSGAQTAERATSECLQFEPDTVRIAGRLTRHTFFGAPGYGENPRTDDRETGFYLELATPVCAIGGYMKADLPAPRNVRRVQLVLDSASYDALRPLLGRRVALRGTLFAAHTGHHHAPLLLTVLRPVRPERVP